MSEPAAPPSPLDAAQARLERALDRLEAACAQAHGREERLEAVAAEASAALGRAAAEVRAALQAQA